MKKYLHLILSILIIFSPMSAYAGTCGDGNCTGSTPWTADTCSSADLSYCVNTCASTGESINVPAGECTWTTQVLVPDAKDLIITGVVGDVDSLTTVITHNGSNVNGINLGESESKVRYIQFINSGGGSSYGSILIQGLDVRIDHCQFTNSGTNGSNTSIIFSAANQSYLPTGLIDHCDFLDGRIVMGGFFTFAKCGIEWANNVEIGDADTVYIEDSTFYKQKGPFGTPEVHHGGNVIDASRGAHYVARYLSISGPNEGTMTHGWQSPNERAAQWTENYGNTYICATDDPYNNAPNNTGGLFQRGGTSRVFINEYSDNHQYGFWKCDVERVSLPKDIGLCDGDENGDGNDPGEANGWPCRDQIGREKDPTAWLVIGEAAPTQTSNPSRLWLNRIDDGNPAAAAYNQTASHIILDRDFYWEDTTNCPANPAGDCTSGIGYGTLANRPADCTTGVAYWATDDDYSGGIAAFTGADHTENITGILYVCSAPNTWSQDYTPDTYPHPLNDDEEVPPEPPEGTTGVISGGYFR